MDRLRTAKNKAEDKSQHPALARVDAAAALPLAGGMSRSPTYDQLEEHSPAAVLRRGNGVAAERVMPADTADTDVTYFIGDGEYEGESALTPPLGGPSIREDSMMSYYAVDQQ